MLVGRRLVFTQSGGTCAPVQCTSKAANNSQSKLALSHTNTDNNH